MNSVDFLNSTPEMLGFKSWTDLYETVKDREESVIKFKQNLDAFPWTKGGMRVYIEYDIPITVIMRKALEEKVCPELTRQDIEQAIMFITHSVATKTEVVTKLYKILEAKINEDNRR